MKFFDLLSMCVRNLIRRKLRTFLTVLGVVVGTSFIVLMLSLGVGIRITTAEMLTNAGDLTMIEVRSQTPDTPLTDEAVQRIQALEHVIIASPTMHYYPNNGYMELYAGRKDRYSNYTEIMGVYPEALEKLEYTALKGELKLGTALDGKTINVVMGPQVPYYFQDTKKRWPNNRVDGYYDDPAAPDPFFDVLQTDMVLKVFSNKEDVKELQYKINVTGIIKPKDNEYESVYATYISIDDLKKIQADFDKANKTTKERGEVDSYDRAKVKVDHVNNVGAVLDVIHDEMGFYVESMEETRKAMQQTTQTIQTILGFVGAVALVAAAISIINTMIMSVYERTREIGVMKVLGCLLGNIRSIFLIEAGLIGLIGGIIGIGISFTGSFFINKYGGAIGGILNPNSSMEIVEGAQSAAQMSVIPPWLVLTGLAISTGIGLLAGFYPAERAVRISALEAIRQE